jgi:hypothetical protein
MNLLGRQEREAGRQVEANLPAKDRPRASARAVLLVTSVVEDVTEKIVVLFHGASLSAEGFTISRTVRSTILR